jgi:hypothetical protein
MHAPLVAALLAITGITASTLDHDRARLTVVSIQAVDPVGEYEFEAPFNNQLIPGGLRIAKDGAGYSAKMWVAIMPETLTTTRTKLAGRDFTMLVTAPPGDAEITLTYGADGVVTATALWLTGESQGQKGQMVIRRKKA